MSGGFLVNGIGACPPAAAVPAAYSNPFYTDPVTGALWLDGAAWVAVTAPVITQGATPTFTVNYAAYRKFGRSVRYQGFVTITGTPGTGATAVSLAPPAGVTVLSGSLIRPIGTGLIYDSSAGFLYRGIAVPVTVAQVCMLATNATGLGYLGADTFTAALATGDQISWDYEFETVS